MFKEIFIVFQKEVKIILRDKKTFIFSVLFPLFFLPLLISLTITATGSFSKNSQRPIVVALNDKNNSFYTDCILKNDVKVHNPCNNAKLLDENKIDADIILPDNFDEKIANGKSIQITIKTNESSPKASVAISKLQDFVKNYKTKVLSVKLRSSGIDEKIINQISVNHIDIFAKSTDKSSNLINLLVPIFLIMFCCMGSSNVAADLTAGEKERSTLEPLLSTRANRNNLLIGKLCATSIVGVVSGICSIFGLFIFCKFFMKDISFNLNYTQFLLLLLISALVLVVFAGVNLMIGLYAKSYKEAQTYLASVPLICMLPVFLVNIVEPTVKTMCIPVLNICYVIKQILQNNINYSTILLVSIHSISYILITTIITCRSFKRENVIFKV